MKNHFVKTAIVLLLCFTLIPLYAFAAANPQPLSTPSVQVTIDEGATAVNVSGGGFPDDVTHVTVTLRRADNNALLAPLAGNTPLDNGSFTGVSFPLSPEMAGILLSIRVNTVGVSPGFEYNFAWSFHTLTVNNYPAGSVTGQTASNSHMFMDVASGTVSIAAGTREGYNFIGWSGAGVADVNSASTSVTMNGNVTVTANWEPILAGNVYHNLTINNSPAGSVSGQTPSGSHAYGSTVAITAGTRTGYIFTGWTGAGVTFANANNANTTFVMPNNNVTITANWTETIVPPTQLPAPVISITGSTVSWAAVANATGYRVYVSGSPVATVTTLNFNLAALNLAVGTHAITVRAIADGTNFLNSVLSAPANFIVAPQQGGQTPPPPPPQDTPPPPPPTQGTGIGTPQLPLFPRSPQQPAAQDQADVLALVYEELDEAIDEVEAFLGIPAPPERGRRVIRFEMNNFVYTIDNVSHTNDVAPFVDPAYDRVMIPLRAVSEALGTEVDWVRETRSVLIFAPTGTQTLVVDVSLPDGMGTPVIINDRVLVPLRFVAERLGAEVRWDGANRAAYVYMYR